MKRRYELEEEYEDDKDPAWLGLTAFLFRFGVMLSIALAAFYMLQYHNDFDTGKVLGSFGDKLTANVLYLCVYGGLVLPIPFISAFFGARVQLLVNAIIFVLAALATGGLLMADFLM